MKPDAVNLSCIRTAIDAVRERDAPHEVDDEHLASLIEHGIGAVPLDQRATLLRAIGNSPQIATIVAELAPQAAAEQSSAPLGTVLGVRPRTWRLGWAACAVLAVAGTAWIGLEPGHSGIQLLDGGVDGPAQDFADSLGGLLRRSTVIILWVSLAALTFPAFLASPREAHTKTALERRGPGP